MPHILQKSISEPFIDYENNSKTPDTVVKYEDFEVLCDIEYNFNFLFKVLSWEFAAFIAMLSNFKKQKLISSVSGSFLKYPYIVAL